MSLLQQTVLTTGREVSGVPQGPSKPVFASGLSHRQSAIGEPVQVATTGVAQWRQGEPAAAACRGQSHPGRLRDPTPTPSLREPDTEARLVIVFEDAIAFGPALDVYHLITAQVSPACAPHECWWDLRALAVARLHEYAVHDAARADIILLAARDAASPSRLIRDRVDGWAARRTGAEGILVALLTDVGSEARRPTRLEQYLGDSARTACLDFLASTYLLRPETDARCSATERQRAETTPGRMSTPPTPSAPAPARHWGINE